jgi:hypothetical protein
MKHTVYILIINNMVLAPIEHREGGVSSITSRPWNSEMA